jgi:hypothetical protein
MKIIKLLQHDWSYPVIEHGSELYLNLVDVIKYLEDNYKNTQLTFVGIGCSGAMLLGALSTVVQFIPNNFEYRLHFKLLRKKDDSTARGREYEDIDPTTNIIIIDDHICSSATITNLALILEEKQLLNNVIGIIASSWYMYDCDKGANININELFPHIQFWIN